MTQQVDVRRLNERGIAAFAAIDWGHIGSAGDPPSHILFDDAYSEVVVFSNGNTRSLDAEATFSTHRELAVLIDRALGNRNTIKELTDDPGLWAWISLLYYSQLRQSIGEHGWKAAQSARFIPVGDSFRYYRHIVFGSFYLLTKYGDNASIFIDGPAHSWSDVNEQLLSVSLIASSEAVIEACNLLYHSPTSKRGVKRGAGGKGPGSARRFREVFWQLYETYDLRAMGAEEILSLLPDEFDRFNPLAVSQE